jgi:hypothetical protein
VYILGRSVSIPYLATVYAIFGADADCPEGRLADAFMAVENVATVRIAADGQSVVYRVDVDADTPEAAVPPATDAAAAVARSLRTPARGEGVDVEEDAFARALPVGPRPIAYRTTTALPSWTAAA